MEKDKIKRLKDRVEKTFGKEVRSPKDFESLCESVFRRTGVLLSSTTLKRVWGYIEEPVTPRRTTLDVLSRYAGWESLDEFLSSETPEVESGMVAAEKINVLSQLIRGDRIRLTWQPSRVCEVEYMGGGTFRIMAGEGTKLKPGDTFTCHLIVAGEPLYLENLMSGSGKPGTYVCGSIHGIRFQRLEKM